MKKRLFKTFFNELNKTPPYNEKSNELEIQLKEQDISTHYEQSLTTFKSIFSYPQNTDIKVREFTIRSLNRRAFIIFISTMVDHKSIQDSIVEKLIENQVPSGNIADIISYPMERTAANIGEITDYICGGVTALFIDGDSQCYIFETTKVRGRGIEKTDNEIIVKGAKESFNERVADNIGLLRKKIKNENLIVESKVISKRSRNDVFLVYEKDLVNDKLLQKIKERLDSIDSDKILDLSILEQHLEERPRSLFPTILYTERPDRAASYIEEGHIILLMSNSPSCLIMPATFWSLIHSPEDHYLRTPYGNFIRILRFAALFVAVFTSSLYIAITNYHVGMIPPDLLMAIAGTRERVPLPSIIEILMMEMAFELIREAGLRVPSPIGPTIGIVGALILGQAAVQANIISPIVIIVIALSGLSSFIISDISMNFAIRLARFLFIFAAGFLGIYGATAFFMASLFYLVSLKSFGIPYFAPMTPHSISSKDLIVRHVPFKERFRPGYLKPKDLVRQRKG
ncbi:spore germination protein [Paenibacillus sp. BSR1-1]|uniref:spore germination protein n=1 Tax=Paenibacillus sp. BSR1-1 TaxID=3020845 RepID=UPI0025B2107D|nr:spore germination protein [Paenibacillus sp. BSR1-1]MDN3018397.1 spore germination protein [Paenibacillus sp. BSR1-1]